ncbi:MAG: hypothetical protein ACPIA8_02210 [Candidatus Puniceispirillaceae bacterium]
MKMIYLRDKQENGTCNSCGYTSWKYKEAATPYSEEICLDSRCRYRLVNDMAESINRTAWDQFLRRTAEPHLLTAKT